MRLIGTYQQVVEEKRLSNILKDVRTLVRNRDPIFLSQVQALKRIFKEKNLLPKNSSTDESKVA
jgi:hypothetical protein